MKRNFKMESDSDSTTYQSSPTCRLGKCEVCNHQEAKYTCPKCEVKTCCMACLNIHKKELKCDGIRDRTKYIPLKKMTKMDFMNDYYFLEECTRYVEDRKTDKVKRYTSYNKFLPPHLFRLRNEAQNRKVTLRFLLQNFSKRISNTTCYDGKAKTIFWRVEWIFPNAGNLKFVDKRCSENEVLSNLLDKYLDVDCIEDVPMKKNLEFYQSRGISDVKILLKSEGIKRCRNRFFLLDCKKTLKENLVGKTIVEFPVIYLCYDHLVEEFDVIDSDEDVVAEANEYQKDLDTKHREKIAELRASKNTVKSEEDLKKEAEEQEKQKKRSERRKMRAERNKKPQNLLFGDNFLEDDVSSDSDQGNETEEEQNAM